MKTWSGRFAEVAANFVLPGLGGLLFDRGSRKNAIWQVVLSGAGMVLAMAGCGLFMSVFATDGVIRLDENNVAQVLEDQEKLYQMLMGSAGVIFGGVLLLGGFLWSLDNAMRRWRSPKTKPPQPPEIPANE